MLLLLPASDFRHSQASTGDMLPGGLAPALEHHRQMAWTTGNVLDSHSPYMAICLAVKDQHESIVEWVEHHLSVGVGKHLLGTVSSNKSNSYVYV